jgi:extracellular factor (EF) 3-hydroxypalmitic acid methyl ester biosynthesis protein
MVDKFDLLNEDQSNVSDPAILYSQDFKDRRSISRNSHLNDQRSSQRKIDKTLNIEINLTFPKDHSIVKPILEITDQGLSFSITEGEGFFEQETILKNIKIFNQEYEYIVNTSQVIHCQTYEIEGVKKHKIGIVFLTKDNISKKRAKRFHSNSINHTKSRISFMIYEEEHRAQLLNFSKYGLSLFVKSPRFVVKKSDILRNINIVIDDKIIYTGDGLIVDLTQKSDSIKLRIALKNGEIEIADILSISNKSKVDYALSKLTDNLSIADIVSSEFRDNISQTSYVLKNTKNILDTFETDIKNYDAKMQTILIDEMFAKLNKEIYPKLDILIEDLDKIFNKINKKEIDIYKIYFQKVLHPLMMLAPVLHRTYSKPLGIAGDYEMMNMFYRNAYEGETLFGEFMHKYTCYQKMGISISTRTDFVCEKIRNSLKDFLKNGGDIFKISSIASGSALELQKLLACEKNTDYMDITLLDFLDQAIEHSQSKINELIKKNKRVTKISFIKESIFNLIKDKNALNKIQNNQNIIYSIGLFEYLADPTCKLLFKLLFEKLREGGILIVGNYRPNVSFQSWMELGLDWFLIYRDKEKLLSLIEDIDCEKFIHTESLGLFQILVLKK